MTHLMYDPGGWSFEVGLGSPCGLAMPLLNFLSPAPGGLKPETVPGLKRPEVAPGALRPLTGAEMDKTLITLALTLFHDTIVLSVTG